MEIIKLLTQYEYYFHNIFFFFFHFIYIFNINNADSAILLSQNVGQEFNLLPLLR